MPILQIGSIVHYVMAFETESANIHRPAVVLDFSGTTCHLRVFTSSGDGPRYASGTAEVSSVAEDSNATPAWNTWHWPE
jgi:hypothetical protein